MIRTLAAFVFLALGTLSAQSTAADERAIRAARSKSNAAIRAHDVDGTVAVMHPDYLGLSSTNTRTTSRDSARLHYAGIFNTRKNVVFVRTPASIAINSRWNQAAEEGRWTVKWDSPDGAVAVGGRYFAKWVKTGSDWKLRAETFVQLDCTGPRTFCGTPPP